MCESEHMRVVVVARLGVAQVGGEGCAERRGLERVLEPAPQFDQRDLRRSALRCALPAIAQVPVELVGYEAEGPIAGVDAQSPEEQVEQLHARTGSSAFAQQLGDEWRRGRQ